MENEKLDVEIDEAMDRLPLGYSPTKYVVVMVAPRLYSVVEDYDGIEGDYQNMSGVFRSKREAEEHASGLSS
jgi:hypothetical protein